MELASSRTTPEERRAHLEQRCERCCGQNTGKAGRNTHEGVRIRVGPRMLCPKT